MLALLPAFLLRSGILQVFVEATGSTEYEVKLWLLLLTSSSGCLVRPVVFLRQFEMQV